MVYLAAMVLWISLRKKIFPASLITVAFTQLGIPMEAMGITIAVNAITDFPATSMNVTGW